MTRTWIERHVENNPHLRRTILYALDWLTRHCFVCWKTGVWWAVNRFRFHRTKFVRDLWVHIMNKYFNITVTFKYSITIEARSSSSVQKNANFFSRIAVFGKYYLFAKKSLETRKTFKLLKYHLVNNAEFIFQIFYTSDAKIFFLNIIIFHTKLF